MTPDRVEQRIRELRNLATEIRQSANHADDYSAYLIEMKRAEDLEHEIMKLTESLNHD